MNNIMIGGANGNINIERSYDGTYPGLKQIQPISHYKIDYILHHYNYLIGQELQNNNFIVNQQFMDFIKEIIDLAHNVVDARINEDDNYASSNPYFNYKNSMNGRTINNIK